MDWLRPRVLRMQFYGLFSKHRIWKLGVLRKTPILGLVMTMNHDPEPMFGGELEASLTFNFQVPTL